MPDKAEQKAAWEMYVELVTRVSVVELGPEEGIVGEALTSLYHLFDITRGILRSYGPAVARPKEGSDLSFGYIAVAILNGALRPLLAKWHPLLLDREALRPQDTSAEEWERAWERNAELRGEMARGRGVLRDYAGLLARVAQVPPLTGP